VSEPNASQTTRARRVLTALRALPPGVLDQLADHAAGPNADQLARVRAALAAPDPEAALVEALDGLTLDDTTPIAPFALQALGRQLGDGAAALRAELDHVRDGRRALIEAGQEALAGATDPALAALVGDALALLGDDAPFAALREALGALADSHALLGALADGAALGAQVGALRARRDAIAGAAARIGELPALLARARAYATARDDQIAAARLALAAATLHDDGWPEAFALALAAELLPEARGIATRIEGRALAEGRLEVVATTAGQLAALAARRADRDAELAAVCDEALARAQLPGGADAARALVARAGRLGAGAPSRAVRAQLLAGQVHELLGDAAAARRAFRDVMPGANALGLRHELGWAALHLGRLEAAQGQAFRGGENLELAQGIGRALGDGSLFALAVAARIEHAADRGTAAAILAEAGPNPPAIRDELRRRFDARWPA